MTIASQTNRLNFRKNTDSLVLSPAKDLYGNGFFAIDRKWKVLKWNEAAENILDMPADQIIGKNIWEVFADKLPVEFYAHYHKAFLEEIPLHFQEYWGEIGKWFEVVTTHDSDCLYVSFKCSSNPLLPGNSEQGVRIMNDLYRYISQITNESLWDWDISASQIFWIDGGHRRAFGYPIENAVVSQRFWEDCIHPDDRKRVLTNLEKVVNGTFNNYWEDEYRFRCADGTYANVKDKGRLIFDPSGKAIRMIGATIDITGIVSLQLKVKEQQDLKQREITEAVITAHENERESIGKELHDNLGQILLAAKLYVQMTGSNENERDRYLRKSLTLINEVIEEVRKISKKLIVPTAEIMSLFENVHILIKDIQAVNPVRINLRTLALDESGISAKIQLNIYRIIQEQLNNIIKHAGANNVNIDISRLKKGVVVHISDDGKGCDMKTKVAGVGLINIHSRVELMHGTVRMKSSPGKGFSIHVSLPVEPVTALAPKVPVSH